MLLALLAFSILWRGGRTLEVTFLLSLVTVFLLFASRRRGEREERRLPLWLDVGVLSFIALTLLAYVFSSTMNYGFDEVSQTVALGLLFLWMARQPPSAHFRLAIIKVLVATVLLSCLIGVVIYAFGPLTRFVGTFLDIRAPWKNAWPTAWAQMLLLAWPIALIFAEPHRARGKARAETLRMILQRCIPVGVILGCLLLSFSRAAILTVAGQVVVLIVYAVRHRAPWKRIAMIIACAFMVALVMFGLSNFLRARNRAVQSLSEKALFLSEEGTLSITERVTFWSQSWKLAARRPLLGFGPGSFRFVSTPLMDDVLETSEHPHNALLKVASERGWPAALVLAALVLMILFPLCRGLCSRTPMSAESALLLTAVLGVIAHNMVDYNLHFIGISLPFVLIVAMLAPETTKYMNKKVVQFGGVILVAGLFIATLHEGFFAITSTLGRRAQARGRMESALRWYRWSGAEWYSRDTPLAQARLQMQAGSLPAAERTVARYTEVINGSDARGWKLRAEVAWAQGKTDDAEQALRRALFLGGFTDLGILRRLLELLARPGKEEALAREKEKADALLLSYENAILANRHFIALSSNVEDFLFVADFLSHRFPADEPKYQVMAAGVDRQAMAQRLRLRALMQ